MAIPRPLVECIVSAIALLEDSPESEIDLHVAVRGLEDIAACLGRLTLDEQREFLAIAVEVAPGPQVPTIVADTLGLPLPGSDDSTTRPQ